MNSTQDSSPERAAMLQQVLAIADGLGQTFAPFCEVVVHDLTNPDHAIIAIHNNLSGRKSGDPATELGLARIADAGYPQVLANYTNNLADGRQVKSTSIGLRDSNGDYVAALCLNVDMTLFRSLEHMIGRFGAIGASAPAETLDPTGADTIRRRIDAFAARSATTPRALKAAERRVLVRELKAAGCLDVRRSMEIVAAHLGVSRAAVYGYAKEGA